MAGAGDGPLGFGPDDGDDAAAAEARRRRLARRQDPDLIAEGRRATGGLQPQPRARLPAGASRYGWFVGVVGVLVIALITLNTLRTGSSGPGSRGVPAGRPVPPFAAPLALGRLDGAVAMALRAGQGGRVPACSLHGPEVLNGCDLWASGPAVLVFFATRGTRCVDELDVVSQVAARHPRVHFAAISILGDREALRRTIVARRWHFPVGFDVDGRLANAYGVAVCPQITYVRRGGRSLGTSLGSLTAAQLDRRVRRLDG